MEASGEGIRGAAVLRYLDFLNVLIFVVVCGRDRPQCAIRGAVRACRDILVPTSLCGLQNIKKIGHLRNAVQQIPSPDALWLARWFGEEIFVYMRKS